MNYKKTTYSFAEVYSKLMKYCAYQERSSFEAKNKAYELGFRSQELDELIDQLIDENFVNDERFAAAFVRGKLNVKRWGRYKISEGLYAKGIKGKNAEFALIQIEETQYLENLNYWVNYKMEREVYTKSEAPKLYRFLQSKGFEGDLISKALKDISLF
jgi:regulatory protein